MFANHFADHRIAWSRVFIATALILLLFGTPPELALGWHAEVAELTGYALLVIATLWRIWCHLFIAGSKNSELAILGPYSAVRNPLYLGNFIGLVGFALALQRPYLTLLLAAGLALFYPAVVAKEERRLVEVFGAAYRDYLARVPRWWPDWSLYREPATLTVSPRHLRKAILDAMWFLWAFAFVEMISEIHEANLLPVLF